MMKKVSVVVPVYNPGEHIDGLIASLRRQSMPARRKCSFAIARLDMNCPGYQTPSSSCSAGTRLRSQR